MFLDENHVEFNTPVDNLNATIEVWNPFRGNANWRPSGWTSPALLPRVFGSGVNERRTVERFHRDAAMVDVVGSWSVTAASTDGVGVTITGAVIGRVAGRGGFDMLLRSRARRVASRLVRTLAHPVAAPKASVWAA